MSYVHIAVLRQEGESSRGWQGLKRRAAKGGGERGGVKTLERESTAHINCFLPNIDSGNNRGRETQ